MTRKKRRMMVVGLAMLALASATALILTALDDSLVYFYSPSDILAKPPGDRRIRIGGLVEQGSIQKDGKQVSFRVTDLQSGLPVVFTGVLPDLFREMQGVVAEGRLGLDGVFMASNVLAKHDETYMPKEVADSLKASGQWQGKTP
jgi:cytochrome c-type biogenesis protein CcmE